MSRLGLPKKLQPAKRAWKSFSNNIKNAPKAMKTTIQRLISTFHSLRYFMIPSKASYSLSHRQVHRQNLAPMGIIINDHHAEPASSSSSSSSYAQGETSRGKDSEKSGIDTVEEAWKAVVARSPVLRVDERAEEFISKFREDMKLQKQRSLLEFQEMLDRSA